MSTSPNKSIRKLKTQFICVHWTGGSFKSSLDWCLRDESDVSYHVIIGPEGQIEHIVPWEYAAWSVGWAKSIDPRVVFISDLEREICSSNHASENLALAGAPPKAPTEQQIKMLISLLVFRFVHLGWTGADVWRIWGHDECAIYPPGHKKAGLLGRKPDPQGSAWLPLEPIRVEVARLLNERK